MAAKEIRLTEPPLRRHAKRRLRQAFELAQRVGINVLPHHFYSQIPDVAELRRTDDWRKESSMTGIAGLDIESQMAFVRDCCVPPVVERLATKTVFDDACRANGEHGFGPVEAAFLYCFLARKRPRRIVQVGCGVATAVMLRAAQDEGFTSEIICVEPYPTDYLKAAAKRGDLRLVAHKAQLVPLEILTDLAPGDLLFVDSTHTVKPGSEVNRIILEVLPRLRDGVFVHYHDIWLPYDYTPGVLTTDLFFWGESTLLHAFLIENHRYTVLAALSSLHYWAQQQLRDALPMYRPIEHTHGYATGWPASGDSKAGHFPSSMYLLVGSNAS